MSTPGTTNYPSALDDKTSLLHAKNYGLVATTLSATWNGTADPISVTSAAGFPESGVVQIGGSSENIAYTSIVGNTLGGLFRGRDGTATDTSSRASGSNVILVDSALTPEGQRGAVIGLEGKVGTGSSTPVANSVLAGTGAGISAWSTAPTVASLGVNYPATPTVAFLSLSNLTPPGYTVGATDDTHKIYPINRSIAVDGRAAGGYAGDNMNVYYAPTNHGDLTLPQGVGFTGQQHNIYIGLSYAEVADPGGPNIYTAAHGSVLGYQSVMYVKQIADDFGSPVHTIPLNEQASYVSTIRDDRTASEGGVNGNRIWLTDLNAQGPIGLRPSALSGVHSTVRNFTNDSPIGTGLGTATFDPTGDFKNTITQSGSAAFVATAAHGALGMVPPLGAQATATSYPVDVAYWAGGSSGSTDSPDSGQGFRVHFMAGGTAGNYGGSAGRDTDPANGIYTRGGIGFFSRDMEQIGFYAFDKFPGSTGLAFVSSVGAGNSLFGVDLTIIGTTIPSGANAHSLVTVSRDLRVITNQASSLSVNGGDLGGYEGAYQKIASFGVGDGSPAASMLNFAGYRHTAFAGSANISVGLQLMRESPGAVDHSLWFHPAGIGIDKILPAYPLDVVGVIHSSSTFVGGQATQTLSATGDTINTQGLDTVILGTSAAYTGLLLQADVATNKGRAVKIINASGNVQTFHATASTAHIATASETIAAGTSAIFIFDGTSTWYRLKIA